MAIAKTISRTYILDAPGERGAGIRPFYEEVTLTFKYTTPDEMDRGTLETLDGEVMTLLRGFFDAVTVYCRDVGEEKVLLSVSQNCHCCEEGTDGTLLHSEASGLRFQLEGTPLIIVSPCKNHVENYRASPAFEEVVEP